MTKPAITRTDMLIELVKTITPGSVADRDVDLMDDLPQAKRIVIEEARLARRIDGEDFESWGQRLARPLPG